MAFKQASRSLQVDTPLGEDAVQMTSFSGTEELSRLFQFQLNLISMDPAIQGTDIVGKNVTFSLNYKDGERRYFNGFVQRFCGGDENVKGVRSYDAYVVPWLWFLTQTSDCRIFQEMTVVQIIEQIFGDLGFSDFDTSRVAGQHPTREYCVQYRETDFNFVSRLMEEEGIFYYFLHEDGKHNLVLADSTNGYAECDEGSVDYPSDELMSSNIASHIKSWQHSYEYRTGAWAHTDYNFKTPKTNLMVNEKTLMKYERVKDFEQYDYPGEYREKPDGKTLASTRMEEIEAEHDSVSAAGDCKTFTPGGHFKVGKHRVKVEEGKEFVIKRIRHQANEGGYETDAGGEGSEYFNDFDCFPRDCLFRPSRVTPRPLISGCQTAVVTGPPGEEIYPDEYGRVKVQFHWDREGKKDQNTTCWIRCQQNIAGNKWGFVALPRIGQEVVVDFLEGDPDRPLITGCVYNADQMPHYALPDDKAKTYIKTNSTKGGDGFNELMFDDKAGEERLFLHAEKDKDVVVKNDSREHIRGDRHRIIGTPDNDEKGNIAELFHGAAVRRIMKHQLETIDDDRHVHVGGGDGEDAGICDYIFDKKERKRIGLEGKHLLVEGDCNNEIGGKLSDAVGGDHHETCFNYAMEAQLEAYIKAGMKVVVEAGATLTIKAGPSFITLGPAGVDISGPLVNINSGGSPANGAAPSPDGPERPQEPGDRPPDEAWDSKTGHKSAPD